MLVGYARISTPDQHLDRRHDALAQVRCEKTFADTVSGAKAARPGLQQALASLREGDTLVVWKLDRLGRSLRDLITIVAGPGSARRRVQKPAGEHRHDHAGRAADLPRLHRPSQVRA